MNLKTVDGLRKDVAIFGNIKVVHSVKIGHIDARTMKPIDSVYSYISKMSKLGVTLGYKSHSFRTTKDSVILQRVMPYKPKDNVKTANIPTIAISYNDIGNIHKLFKDVSDWFALDEYRNNIYKYDNNGYPFGISQKYENLATSTLIMDHYGVPETLSIQPTVISDLNMPGVAYPGVVFKCRKGVIGTCTVSEFAALKTCVTNLLDNLYITSLQLISLVQNMMLGDYDDKVHQGNE